jgi:hypothetical protein
MDTIKYRTGPYHIAYGRDGKNIDCENFNPVRDDISVFNLQGPEVIISTTWCNIPPEGIPTLT